MYTKEIAATMTLTRYGEIKCCKKLCLNVSSPKRWQENYDPAYYKYDLIYKCIVNNINAILAKADETQIIDKPTWGHAGYGESGTGTITLGD